MSIVALNTVVTIEDIILRVNGFQLLLFSLTAARDVGDKEGLVRTNNDTANAKLRQQKMIATDATLFLIDFHHLQRIRAEEIAFYNNENKNSRPFSLRARECCFRRLNNDEVILFENLDSFLCCLTSLFIFHIARRQIFSSRTHSKGGKNFTVLNSVLVNKKSIEVGQLFSLGTASNIPEKAFTIPNTI